MTPLAFKHHTDSELLALSIDSPNIFEELVERHEAAFLRRAVSILKNREEAQDAVQDTFVKMYISAKKFKTLEGASFLSWAYEILNNECYSRYRALTRRKKFTFPLSLEAQELVPDMAQERREQKQSSHEYALYLISKLPLLLKLPTKLHFIDGFPQKKVAEMIGVSNEVIRTRIHRAKKIMRKHLYQYAS